MRQFKLVVSLVLLCFCSGFFTPLQAEAVTIFSNYGVDDAYFTGGGTPIHYDFDGFPVEQANAFTPIDGPFLLSAIELSIFRSTRLFGEGPLDVNVYLRTDLAGAPDAILEAFHVYATADAGLLTPILLPSSVTPNLEGGQQYWVTAAATELGSDFVWGTNSTQFGGPKARRSTLDGAWEVFNFQTARKDAFRVSGSPVVPEPPRGVVPEPTSMILFGLGALGLISRRRSRRSLDNRRRSST